MNITLLRKVQKAILLHPHQFNMEWWYDDEDSMGDKAKGCGTAGCIGGWAIAIGRRQRTLKGARRKYYVNYSSTGTLAGTLLQLNIWQSDILFCEGRWPTRYHSSKAKTAKRAAELAVDRIDLFIRSNGTK